ncbi:MAG TPA: cyclase family protein [Acidimicrobiia bacterium]
MSTVEEARPTQQSWWPSRYGAGDQAGTLNEVTAAAVRRGVALVRQGRVFDLAHVLDEHIPAFPGRTFRQHLTAPEGLDTANDVHWVVEYVNAPSQIGTHMDGLNHLHIGERAYNGNRLADITEDYGTSRLGIETLPQVVTRGVLLDIAALRGVDHLGPGEVITPADAEAALQRQQLAVTPGDAVLFHTGWGRHWGVDNDAYVAGEPGPGMALGHWLVDHRVALTGCDTWSFGPVPPEDPDRPFVVPQTLNAQHGLVVLENLRLAEVAGARVGEFMFVVSHAKLRGATGAWVAPLAVI